MLRANSWQWTALEDSKGRIEVERPASYRVTFNTDASLTIAADCNNAVGSYQGESGKLTIEIGPATMADCSSQSYSNKFIDALAQATRYDFDGAHLRIKLADGGIMRFAPAAASASPAMRRTFGVTLTMPAQPARPDLQPHEGSL